jgi:hypothetical protein
MHNASGIRRNNTTGQPLIDHRTKSGITHREILGAMVKATVPGAAGGHASSGAATFFKYVDFMSGVVQGLRAAQSCDAGTDHGYTRHKSAFH